MPAIALAVSCVIVYLGFQTHQRFATSTIEQFQENQAIIAESAAAGMETLVHSLEKQLMSLSRDARVTDIQSRECMNALFDFYNSNDDYVYAAYRIDRVGRIARMFPQDINALGADISGQAHVKELFRTRRMVVSGRFHAVEGFDAITIHMPVFRDGRLDGSVATLVRISDIERVFISPIHGPRHGARAGQSHGWLIDDHGVIISHPDAKIVGRNIMEANRIIHGATAAQARGVCRATARGEPSTCRFGNTIIAHTPMRIGSRNWGLIVSTPESEIAVPIARNFKNTLLFMTLVVGLISGAAYWVARTVMRAANLEKRRAFLEEKIALQEELQHSRDRLEAIIRTMPSGLFTVNKERRILTWNKTAEAITGYTAEETLGQPCSICLMKPCDRMCGLLRADIPKPIIGAECALTRKDGTEIVIQKNVDYLRDASGEITGGIESFIDITAAKKAEEARINSIALGKEIEQLRRMDEIKTNFLSMVSHELRTPLSVILGNITLALRGRFGELNPDLATRMETIRKRASDLNSLIDNLLNLTRLETGKADIHREPIYIAQCLDESTSMLRNEIEDKNLRIMDELDPAAPVVFADLNMIRQVFSNVIGNAVKFTPEGGTISVASRPVNGSVEIIVRDTGVGIPDDALPHVFDRFYQADNSPTRSYGGTGLGLSIVREIITLHHGDIAIRSKEGAGTEVAFTLSAPEAGKSAPAPAHVDDPQTAEPAGGTAPEKDTTVLLVDDDVDFLNLICDMFETTRFRVVSATDINSGLELLDAERPSLVLLDLRLSSESDGYTFMEKMSGRGDTPVVVLSASVDRKHQDRARSLGAKSYLTKPIAQGTLLRTIEEVLAARRG